MTAKTVRVGVPAISGATLGFFRFIVRGYFRRSFHGVRARGVERFTQTQGPLIVYANHGSWWDPLVCFFLSDRLMRERRHYAPMDAEALERYSILKRVGVFGVELESARGAVRFLRTGAEVLASGGVLWVTPQGKFVDARARPLEFKAGMAALAARVARTEGECTVLPLALEYTFWDERTPECLLEFGEAIRVRAGDSGEMPDGRFEGALTAAMDSLKECALRRDAGEFRTLSAGRAGAGGFYALGLRLKALVTRRDYRSEHTVDGGRG